MALPCDSAGACTQSLKILLDSPCTLILGKSVEVFIAVLFLKKSYYSQNWILHASENNA